MRASAVLTAVALSAAAVGCSSDSCREYSKYSCAELEEQTYNVLVYPPDNGSDAREYFAGETVGLHACGSVAHGYAETHHFADSSEWSYICCLRTDESACAEKHR